jgi:hypothetical protein
MSSDIAVGTAHLDGYVSGLAARDGDIREHTAGAFVVAESDPSDTPEKLIHDFYAAQTDFQFSGSQRLESGLRELEHQLCSYVIRRPMGLDGQGQQFVEDRRKYLAFRIMDMVDTIAPEAHGLRTVYKLESKGRATRSDVTFFCIKTTTGFLVLQFNDDSPFIRAQSRSDAGSTPDP